MSDKPTDTINDVIAEIGLSTAVTNAEWGRLFADALIQRADDDAILYALSDAGEKYRSQALSRTRKAARTAVDGAIRTGGTGDSAEIAMQRQMAFEVGYEGVAPMPLLKATHEFISAAVAYAERQYQGFQDNLLFLKHAESVTRPFPGQTVESLINAGLLAPDAFAAESQAA